MIIDQPTPVSLLDSVLTADAIRAEVNAVLLNKVKETEKTLGSAMVALIEAATAPPPEPPPGLNEVA